MTPELSVADWPSQRRVGRVVSGEHKRLYVFVWPEIKGRWAFYTSEGGDDILPDFASVIRWIPGAEIVWLSPEEDIEIEREVFKIRPIYRSEFDPPLDGLARLASRLRSLVGSYNRTPINDAIQSWERTIAERHS